MRIGIISDTHGLLRPAAIEALRGADAIVHGGDIGAPEILAQLAAIAPLHVVRGNNDTASWAEHLPHQLDVRFGSTLVRIVHDLKTLHGRVHADGVHVVISGHSHRPAIARVEGVLYVNPGSAGPRRFRLPVSVAQLAIDADEVNAELQELAV